jgi:23S rRNA A2030 N6-methylase RlmJ
VTSAMANYDHHRKAGNQGDVVKHPALIAAVDTVVAGHGAEAFRYADAFAGYAWNPLVAGNEWNAGIGRIGGHPGLQRNQHVALWANWYGVHGGLQPGQRYPGSARIVADVCRQRGTQAEMALWDISNAACADLVEEFGGEGHAVFHEAASCADPLALDSDLLFLDPPDKSHWTVIHSFLQRRVPERPTIVWLPIGADTTATPPNEDTTSSEIRAMALAMPSVGVTKVRWHTGGRTIGCQLVYCLPSPAVFALRAAVNCIVEIADWNVEHYSNAESVMPDVVLDNLSLAEVTDHGGTKHRPSTKDLQ